MKTLALALALSLFAASAVVANEKSGKAEGEGKKATAAGKKGKKGKKASAEHPTEGTTQEAPAAAGSEAPAADPHAAGH